MNTTRTFLVMLVLSLSLLACAPAGAPDSTAELSAQLESFLAGVDKRNVHDAFWADDLIYTSSDGTRFGKDVILAGFDGESGASGVAYSAEDIDIRQYGETAIVAFRLVGSEEGADADLNYLNTGTFLRRDGRWQVVAWQATKIPESD